MAEKQTPMTDEAQAMLEIAKILDAMPSNEERAKVMAMASAAVGHYDYARKFATLAEQARAREVTE